MKNYVKYIFLLIILFYGCTSSKVQLDKVEPKISNLNTKEVGKQEDKDNNTEREKQRQKQIKKEVKESRQKQKELSKESTKKKKAADKERKKKEKKQEELIKNAAKEERKRIEEERRKEKENLLNIINIIEDNKDKPTIEQEQQANNIPTIVKADTSSLKDTTGLTIEKLLEQDSDTQTNILADNMEQEDNTPAFLKKFKKKKSSANDDNAEQVQKKKKLTTMDKVLFMMDEKNKKINGSDTINGKSFSQYYLEDTTKENFIKRTWHKLFPKKVERKITYENIYKEEPKSILILYPWNRSDYGRASEMLYMMASKELGKKGYYVYPVLAMMQEYKKDSSFSSHYAKISDVKNIRVKYNCDAVMFVTIYRFDNPYWSSATKAVAHYTMISTKTLDTLFARQVEFNYDTPIPPKEYHNKDLELDEEQVYDLGVMEQMQWYSFLDIPYGPYHKKYKKDKKRFSNQKEVKYKINVRPS